MSELPIRDRVTALLRNGKWSRWISRGTWTLIDRGLFALSNFTLNIVLARWMSVEDYGAFAIAFSVFLIIGAAQSSLVVGPLLVFGPKRYRDRYEEYLGLLIIGQLVLSLFVSVGLVLVAGGFFLWGSTDIGAVLLALALAGPFILQVWLLRQSGYVKFQSKRAAGAGVVYMVLLMAGTFLLNSLAILSPATALFLMAAVSLSVAVWLSIQQRARFFGANFLGSFASDIALQHWRYARWMLPARLVNAARSNLLFFVLAAWGGLDATGAMRALMNLVMPIAFMEHSLNLITVPILVRARISRTLGEKVILGMVLFVVGSLVYAAALVLFQDEIIAILYSDRYRSYVNLVWIVALIPVVQSASSIPSATLNAMERPKAIFWALLGGATCTATVGLGAVAIAGLLGAIVALLISAGVIMVLLLWFLRVALRDEVADHAK